MAKKVVLNVKGLSYTLEYNVSSVRRMEANGFSLESSSSVPLNTVIQLFEGGLYKKHKTIAGNKAQKLFEEVAKAYDISTLTTSLIELVMDVYSIISGDNDEDNEDGNDAIEKKEVVEIVTY